MILSLTGGLDRHTHGRTKISLSVPRSCRYYSYLLYWIYRRTDGQRYLYLEVASRLENNSQVTPLKNLSNLGPVSSRIASFQVWMNPAPPPNSAPFLSPCPPTVPPPLLSNISVPGEVDRKRSCRCLWHNNKETLVTTSADAEVHRAKRSLHIFCPYVCRSYKCMYVCIYDCPTRLQWQ